MSRLLIALAGLISVFLLNAYWRPALGLVGIDQPGVWADWAHMAFGALRWAFGAICVNLAIKVFFWERHNGGHQNGRMGAVPVPKLLVDMVSLVVWLAAIVSALAVEFEVEVYGLLTTSGIAIAVIGFALRNIIADVFTGIALGVEQPFRTGDWIELEDGTIGRVDEINWRATRLITKDELTKIVPNSYLATHPFTNYHAPETFFREHFSIVLEYDVTSYQAERILLSAVSQVPEMARIPREPEVRIVEYTSRGVKWEVNFWLPDYPKRSEVRNAMVRNILRNLHWAGIKVPGERVDHLNLLHPTQQKDEVADEVAFLHGIDLFRSLEPAEFAALRAKMRRTLCVAGRAVVTEGEREGASLFVVKEGFLNVTVTSESGGGSSQVGWLAAGMFFGEMSLLTGAPRSATVTAAVDSVLFEITADAMAPLLKSRPDLMRRLSEALADRQLQNEERLRSAPAAEVVAERARLTERMFQAIAGFFGAAKAAE